jgi:hypothetical protein
VHEVGIVRENGEDRDQEDIIRDFLKENSCKDPRIYSGAAYVAARVSFTGELQDPEQIKADADNFPALRTPFDSTDSVPLALAAALSPRLSTRSGITGRASLASSSTTTSSTSISSL